MLGFFLIIKLGLEIREYWFLVWIPIYLAPAGLPNPLKPHFILIATVQARIHCPQFIAKETGLERGSNFSKNTYIMSNPVRI